MKRAGKILLCSAAAAFIFIGYAREAVMAQDKEIQLPQPKTTGTVSLEQAIAQRRSIRSFASKDLNQEQISQLLWAGQGQTSGYKRAAPSAGSLYPMEVYLLTKDGLFHYASEGHKLHVLGTDDLRGALAAASGQSILKDAAADIIIGGVSARIVPRYGERGMRYLYIEAGHIAENIHLQAVSLGLVSLPVGSFNDSEVQKALGMPSECRPVYIVAVGYAGSPEEPFSTMESTTMQGTTGGRGTTKKSTAATSY